jgi:hypothetical protein
MIDYDSVGSRVRAFDERHGDYVVFNGWIYFQDGAVREINPMGPLIEPPENAVKRQEKIVWFWQKKTELAIEEFTVRKRSMLVFVRAHINTKYAVPGRDAEQVQILKNLRKKVVAANTCLDLAKAKLKELQPNVERDERAHAEDLQKLAEYEQEISQIEV